MKRPAYVLITGMMLVAMTARAHGPKPMPLQNVPIPPVPGLLDGPDPIVIDEQKAIVLGKALFWDVNVGSDGMACGSCHFHAGADRRVKNQLTTGGPKSPQTSGQTFEPLPSGAPGGANYTLRRSDFPLFRFNNPFNKASGLIGATDDVVSSSGTFSGQFSETSRFVGANDTCAHSADPVFHVNGTRTRRVEPRNAPTVINTIFNHRNFWDGRANNIFNGSNNWGERDPDAGVWVKVNARTVSKRRLRLENSSLASLATAPPLSDTEMGCQQRKWPDIGRKLLSRQPLQSQKVHPEDSILGSLSLSSAGELRPGLGTTYRTLVTQAFNPKFWSYSGRGPFGAPAKGLAYDQMEANFPMFFGIALQLYQGILVSDQAPIDLTRRDPISGGPTWEGLGYSPEKIARLKNGLNTFVNQHCNLCHAGLALTVATIIPHSMLLAPMPGKTFGPPHAPIAYGRDALGPPNAAAAVGISRHVSVVNRDGTAGGPKLHDFGFANTGVANPADDPGVGGVDDFGNPLSFADQYVEYLLGNTQAIKDPGIATTRSCDFVAPLAFNIPGFTDDQNFWTADGLQIDGSREGTPRNQDCLFDAEFGPNVTPYIPTIAAAQAAKSSRPAKLAVAKQAVFKIPTLRNIELTGPYMHNGGLATLEEVTEFYSRHGNVDNADKHNLVDAITMGNSPKDRADLIEFLKSLTDDRVRYEQAPFDHPEIAIPHGHVGDHNGVEGNSINPRLAADEMLVIPAVGRHGSAAPLQPFDTFLSD